MIWQALVGLLILFSVFVVIVAMFFIFREVVCWYWKIDQHLEHLEAIHKDLDLLVRVTSLDEQRYQSLVQYAQVEAPGDEN